jgi:hypothetical protein
MRSPSINRRVALLMATGLVHVALPTSPMPARAGTGAALPPSVADMRTAILEAVQSGQLEDLKIAVDLNELKPELDAAKVPDPIAFWRAKSRDGTGRDVLAVLGVLLDGPYAIEPLGKDPENTRLFIWPAFAERPLANLTAIEDVQLKLLEPPEKVAKMKAAGRYSGWRVVIGADGVWHVFRRYD